MTDVGGDYQVGVTVAARPTVGVAQMGNIGKGADGANGLSIYTTSNMLGTGGTGVTTSMITVPPGRTIQVGDLLVSAHPSSPGRVGRVASFPDANSVLAQFVSEIAGAAGTPTWRGTWGSGVAYAVNDAVYVASSTNYPATVGSSYVCTVAHTSTTVNAPGGAYWTLLARAGAAGPAGALNIQRATGTWFFPFASAATTASPAAWRLQLASWVADSTFTLTGVACEVTGAATSTGEVWPVVYADNGGLPGQSVLIPSPAVDGTTVGVKTVTGLSVPITAGKLYWIGAVSAGSWTARSTAVPAVAGGSIGLTDPTTMLPMTAGFGLLVYPMASGSMTAPPATLDTAAGTGFSFATTSPPRLAFQVG